MRGSFLCVVIFQVTRESRLPAPGTSLAAASLHSAVPFLSLKGTGSLACAAENLKTYYPGGEQIPFCNSGLPYLEETACAFVQGTKGSPSCIRHVPLLLTEENSPCVPDTCPGSQEQPDFLVLLNKLLSQEM